MNYYIITGTSRGIGKAITELLLEQENNFVFGVSRSNKSVHKNFKDINIDLSNLNKVKEFEFPALENAKSIVLINNSASKSEVKPLGKRTPDNMIENFNVNLVSPALMMNSFLNKYKDHSCKKMIINISSGAAFRPIESWSTYCATKAGLAMMSEVADIEQKLKYPENPVHIFNYSPGVVDTDMQADLRKVSPEDFSMVGTFVDYHKNKELAHPDDVAKKLYKLIIDPVKFEKVTVDHKNPLLV